MMQNDYKNINVKVRTNLDEQSVVYGTAWFAITAIVVGDNAVNYANENGP
jgi:hypothetical protein